MEWFWSHPQQKRQNGTHKKTSKIAVATAAGLSLSERKFPCFNAIWLEFDFWLTPGGGELIFRGKRKFGQNCPNAD